MYSVVLVLCDNHIRNLYFFHSLLNWWSYAAGNPSKHIQGHFVISEACKFSEVWAIYLKCNFYLSGYTVNLVFLPRFLVL